MKRTLLILIILIFISTASYAVEDEYLDIGLTRPIKSKYSVNLSSGSGFAIYSEDGRYLGDINETKIKVDFKQGAFTISSNDGFLLHSVNGNFMLSNRSSADGIISVGDMSYRAYIKFKSFEGSPVVINRIRLEDYLKGVVPAEIGPSSQEEALRAQAVASRSFALANINKMIKKGYNMDDTTACQAYFGTQKEDPRTSKAVDDTRGIVARYNGEIANTIFFSTSAGVTENAADVWGGNLPYLTSVKDPYSASSKNFNWELNLSNTDLQKVLINNKKDVGFINNIKLNINPTSGGVQGVIFTGDKGQAEIKATVLRTALGSTKFRSTWFRVGFIPEGDFTTSLPSVDSQDNDIFMMSSTEKTVDRGDKKFVMGGADSKTIVLVKRTKIHNRNENKIEEPTISQLSNITYGSESYNVSDTIKIVGRGYGHGVGMPQAGARVMAEAGTNYEEILKYYFKGVEIGK
ncbi:MAG: SpoIID/LytB domain-containing protein [Tissierellia bacterium]|nr:SpoIID/LytB domain-containing protein [Tissierellia bacterium]